MCIRDSLTLAQIKTYNPVTVSVYLSSSGSPEENGVYSYTAVSYTHLRAHETVLDLVCRLLLEKKNQGRAPGFPSQLDTTDTHPLHPLNQDHDCNKRITLASSTY